MVLRDNVDRKLVKQTVMTSVYGVTFVGARQQIGNRLKERGWDDERLVYKASCYGARVSCSSISSKLCLPKSHLVCHKVFGHSNFCPKPGFTHGHLCCSHSFCVCSPVSTNVMSPTNISRQVGSSATQVMLSLLPFSHLASFCT